MIVERLMLKRNKLVWLIIFIFSVIAMTLGILDILSKNYVSGILYLIIGLMFFIDSFDISLFLKKVTFKSFFKNVDEDSDSKSS